MKEVARGDELSKTMKQREIGLGATGNFDLSGSGMNGGKKSDNPFKNLTTFNVVQNVVNYNIGATAST